MQESKVLRELVRVWFYFWVYRRLKELSLRLGFASSLCCRLAEIKVSASVLCPPVMDTDLRISLCNFSSGNWKKASEMMEHIENTKWYDLRGILYQNRKTAHSFIGDSWYTKDTSRCFTIFSSQVFFAIFLLETI